MKIAVFLDGFTSHCGRLKLCLSYQVNYAPGRLFTGKYVVTLNRSML